MAQAIAEPSKNQEKSLSLANTDELLSQLAGNEIDRLLAEADAKPAPAELSRTNVDVAIPQAAAASSEEAALSKQIDDIFVELEKGQAKPETTKADVAPAEPAKTEAGKTEPLTEGAERAALLEAAGFNPTSAPADADGDSQDPVHESGPVGDERSEVLRAAGFQPADKPAIAETPVPPFAMGKADDPLADVEEMESLPSYLKPLVWMNAPLASASPAVRQVLGKVGILTFVNALVVLAYVVFFRKH
jgi:hypothetical protein